MNITKHALRRYTERFKDFDTNEEVNQAIVELKDLFEQELNKMNDNAIEIYRGKFNEQNSETIFKIVDNIILVCDLANTKLITLYRVDFGFGRSIDKDILDKLKEDLENKDEIYILELEKVEQEKESKRADLEQLDEQIKGLEETLKSLGYSRKALKDYIENIINKADSSKNDRDDVARKIIYSKEFKSEADSYK